MAAPKTAKKMHTQAKATSHKQSSVVKPGTGSGSRPQGGSTKTAESAPMDNHTQGRKGSVNALK